MRILLYTNENEKVSYVLTEKDDGSLSKSEPHSHEEYIMFSKMHRRINSHLDPNSTNPFIEILIKELGEGI